MRGARGWLAGAGMVVAIAPAPVRADSVVGTRGGGYVTEEAHDIAVALHRGHAQLVVRRTLDNGGTVTDEAIFDIDLPTAAAAIGLRTRGTKKWYAGDLMGAARAAARYRKLTGFNPNVVPKDPTILYWTSPRSLAMQVFPIAPGTKKSVEYTLVMPMEYEDGAYRVRLPVLGSAELHATYTLRAADKADTVRVDGAEVELPYPIAPEKKASGFDVMLVPDTMPTLSGTFASVDLGKRRIVRWELAAGRQLSTPPEDAQVAVVLDASRSVDATEAQAQHTAAIAYLHHLDDASVALLHFDRAVRESAPPFVDRDDAIKTLAEGAPEARNGSAAEVALRRADELLAARPEGKPRRILVLSDLKTRERLTPAAVKKLGLQSGAIVHIATVTPGEARLARADGGPWGRLAASTGGVRWDARAHRTKALSTAMKRVFEEWARPVRIDALRVGGKPADVATIHEGEGLQHLGFVRGSMSQLKVTGKLWSKPVARTFKPTRKSNRLGAALASADDLQWGLTRKEIARLGRAGGAVTRETSYLAIEPGVRPSSAGFKYTINEEELLPLPRVRSASAMVKGGGGGFDPHTYLQGLLEEAFEDCGGESQDAEIEIETTGMEIVDVLNIKVEGSNAALGKCLEKAAWALELPFQYDAVNRRVYAVNLNW